MTDIRPNQCFKCGAMGHLARACPNVSKRDACFTCGKDGHRSAECPQKHLKNPNFRPDDWVCSRCSNVNYARRAVCNVCGAAKPSAAGAEERVGFGGGFRENANVQYRKHNSEDDEFDDFGRPKKAFRGRTVAATNIVGEKQAAQNPQPSPPPPPPADDDDDDDDDGKYDAWGSDSEGATTTTTTTRKPSPPRRRSRSRSRSPRRDNDHRRDNRR